MVPQSPSGWSVRAATFAVWLLAAGSAAFWALKLGGASSTVAPTAPAARASVATDPAAIARLLGGAAPLPGALPMAAAPPALASRFVLVGVVANTVGGGAALISVDGKPPRPYRVGAAVDEGLVVQAVQGRKAVLAAQRSGPALVTLELPPINKR